MISPGVYPEEKMILPFVQNDKYEGVEMTITSENTPPTRSG